MVQGADGGVEFQTRAGPISPTAIGSQVVDGLCRSTGLDPTTISAVVTVPASFEAAQCEATRAAVRGAGFSDAQTIAEPVATALAYLDRNSIHYGAVFDLGGGTFDLAVIDCWEKPMAVLAHGGDPYLGGDDIDRALAISVADEVLETRRWDLRANAEVFERLVFAAERVKIELSGVERATLDINEVDAAAPPMPPVVVERARVWRLASRLVGRAFQICDEVLGDAGLRAQDLQAVFMAGGATLMPDVRGSVAEYFGHRVRCELNPMHVVGIGASLAAARPALSGLLQA
jgi:molecular chaperone DnaK